MSQHAVNSQVEQTGHAAVFSVSIEPVERLPDVPACRCGRHRLAEDPNQRSDVCTIYESLC
jgi:hypothetical protein